MRKLSLLLIFPLIGCLLANAAQKIFCVQLSDGKVDVYQLLETPKVTFVNNEFQIATSSATVQYDADQIEGFFFSKSDAVASTDIDTFFEITSDRIAAKGTNTLYLYKLDGTLIASSSPVNGIAAISTSSLNPGIYIVKMGDKTVKFIFPSR